MSAFPVTISAVGFGKVVGNHKHVIVHPEMSSEHKYPTRLEPRCAATYYASKGEKLPRSSRLM